MKVIWKTQSGIYGEASCVDDQDVTREKIIELLKNDWNTFGIVGDSIEIEE